MTYGRLMAQYRKMEVETAGKMDLVIMCYDKAIQSLGQAKALYEEKAYEEKGRSLRRALDIVNELRLALDLDKGGEIARNLDALYEYLTRSLLQGDLRRDLRVFDEGVRILSTLKSAWEQIAQVNEGVSPPPRSSASLAQRDRSRAAA